MVQPMRAEYLEGTGPMRVLHFAPREARAKVIAAEGEHKSSKALMLAAQNIVRSPPALQVGNVRSFSFVVNYPPRGAI